MQLDLFADRPAKIIVFPHAHRHALVRQTAIAIAGRSGNRRQSCWDRVITDIIEELTRAGLDRAGAVAQLRAFREAVRQELVRRSAA